jgi:hypothetical protein
MIFYSNSWLPTDANKDVNRWVIIFFGQLALIVIQFNILDFTINQFIKLLEIFLSFIRKIQNLFKKLNSGNDWHSNNIWISSYEQLVRALRKLSLNSNFAKFIFHALNWSLLFIILCLVLKRVELMLIIILSKVL